jgi:drug/metabolite transporter (DMT)-like permease
LIGILICLIGAILIGYGDFTLSKEAFMGDILAILGAVTVAGYFIIGRILRPNVNLINYTFMVYGSAAVFLLLASMLAGVKLIGYSSSTYMIFLLMGIVPQLLGHSSLNWALRFMPATLVTIAILGEPVGATLLAKWILDENPTVLQIVGGIVILTGIFIAFRRANNTTNV